MYNATFVDDCLNGKASIFNIDDYIEYWHTNETTKTLREFLGLTEYEYEEWGKNSDVILRDILRCRIDNIDFKDYQSYSDEQRIAARSYNQDDIDKLKEALNND